MGSLSASTRPSREATTFVRRAQFGRLDVSPGDSEQGVGVGEQQTFTTLEDEERRS